MYISNLHIPVRPENTPTFDVGPATRTFSDRFFIRDPFILLYGDSYYLYASCGPQGVGVSVSLDLEHWTEPYLAFRTPADFHGVKDFFWAPECHYYKGAFYLITSVFSSRSNHRNVAVYRAATPLGPFEDITDGSITPREWDAIDGTLYVDETGQPWLIFVHEWTSMPDGNGSMEAVKLSDDLSHFVGEPTTLFYAKDASWAGAGVTDGPYLYRSEKGPLYMIWSNFLRKNPDAAQPSYSSYAVGQAVSRSGSPLGPWEICDELIFQRGDLPDHNWDGGHGMLFLDKENCLRMVLHGPNKAREDGVGPHAILFKLEESAAGLRLLKPND